MLSAMRSSLSRSEARRIALAAQGFARERPTSVTPHALHAAIRRLGVVQIDSVNVFSRSHYMPFFSRLGPYDRAQFDRLAFGQRGRYTEYWAHVAAVVPADDWALWGFRMQDHAARVRPGDEWYDANESTVQWVRRELARRGPSRPADIEDDARGGARGPWWDWSVTKVALERLFLAGEVAIAGRRGFERRYALAEDVIAPDVLARRVDRADAIRELVARAAASYGVATTADLADYYRLGQRETTQALRDLVDSGDVRPVEVAGWGRNSTAGAAWLHRDAKMPRTIERTAVLTPFDPVVWFRDRAARLFDFDYRIEIYTPAPKRRFGYYSLPVLSGEHIVGRIDLKADRARSRLLVQSAWWERAEHAATAEAVAMQLRDAATWQGLEEISVGRWGDAADSLADVLRTDLAHAHRHDRAATGG